MTKMLNVSKRRGQDLIIELGKLSYHYYLQRNIKEY